MRHKTYATRLLVFLALGLVVSVLLVGCDNAQEAAYRDQISSVIDRWNTTSAQVEQAGNESIAQMNQAARIPDPNAALTALRTAVDTFIPRFQKGVDEVKALHAELSQMQVPPKFTVEHKMLVNGMSTVANSLDNQTQAMGLLRSLQPGQMDAALVQIETADSFLSQGMDNLEMATGYLLPVNWPLVISVLILLLAACVGCGIWAGKMADRDGRSFKGYFCLGFFLGLIGVLITHLLIRRDNAREWQRAESLAASRQVNQPGGTVFLSDMISQGGTFDGAYAAAAPGFSPTGPGGFPEPQRLAPQPVAPQTIATPAPRPQQRMAPFGHCPACGIELPQPGAFCLKCGAPIPNLD